MEAVKTNHMQQWQFAALAIAIVYVAIVFIWWDTSLAFYDVWTASETYSHGFIIFPISLWLLWQKRAELIKVAPDPAGSLLVLALVPVAIWVLARLTGVQVIEQLAFVGFMVVVAASVLGWKLSLYLAFPLLFLLFAVPVGEDLVQPMMEFTATFTVEALKLTGIPVYREGLWFMLPTGSWSVVEACSGVRYIIASVTLGFLYAYVSYNSLKKRILFVLFSFITPVIANGIRAYMIVIIGHLSDMELATGVDHLIYGWVFFGVVMLFIFWVGGFWQEPHREITVSPQGEKHYSLARYLTFSSVAVVALALGAWGEKAASTPAPLKQTSLGLTGQFDQWRSTGLELPWTPSLLATDFSHKQVYRKNNGYAVLVTGYYPNQRQGHEAISADNAVVGTKRRFQQERTLKAVEFDDPDMPAKANQTIMIANAGGLNVNRLLVWQWYRIGDSELTNSYSGKFVDAWNRIVSHRGDGAWFAVATPLPEGMDLSIAQATLKDFVMSSYPVLKRSMDSVIDQGE